jgi:hypothetical protein
MPSLPGPGKLNFSLYIHVPDNRPLFKKKTLYNLNDMGAFLTQCLSEWFRTDILSNNLNKTVTGILSEENFTMGIMRAKSPALAKNGSTTYLTLLWPVFTCRHAPPPV